MKKIVLVLSVFMGVLVWADSVPKNSIYQVRSSWKDQNNQSVSLKDYSGKKTLIGMIYSMCPHACPMTISKMQEIEREIAKYEKKNYRIILASFDPERDTPARLKEYMAGRKLDEKQWTFLSASKDSVARELAVALGISYKKLDDGEFSHSNIITLLDEKGVVLSKIESLSAKPDPIINSLKK